VIPNAGQGFRALAFAGKSIHWIDFLIRLTQLSYASIA